MTRDGHRPGRGIRELSRGVVRASFDLGHVCFWACWQLLIANCVVLCLSFLMC